MVVHFLWVVGNMRDEILIFIPSRAHSKVVAVQLQDPIHKEILYSVQVSTVSHFIFSDVKQAGSLKPRACVFKCSKVPLKQAKLS